MALEYKIDVLEALKAKGYNTTRLKNEKILSCGTVQRLREKKPINWEIIAKICDLLECQPSYFLQYVDYRNTWK